MSVLAVIGTYQHRIDTIVCFSEGWKSGFVLCKLNKVQACTPPSFPFFFWAVWASGNDALKSEMTAQIPIRLLTDYWFHEKSARCPSSYPKAFRLLPKSGSSKVCFELLKTLRVTLASLAAELPLRSRATCFWPAAIVPYSLYLMPYCFILPYSVVRPMPSSSAASERLPSACFRARIICLFSISTFFKDKDASPDSRGSSKFSLSAVITSPLENPV